MPTPTRSSPFSTPDVKPLLLAAALALSACGPRLSPAEHYELAEAAIDAGEASEARRHVRAAGAGGHLHASSKLASAYRSGSFRQAQAEGVGTDSGARLLATRRSDWEARRWTRHTYALLRQPTADPDLRRMQAADLLNGRPDDLTTYFPLRSASRGAPDASPAQRDSAYAVLRQLVAEGHAEAAHRLAWLSESDAEHERWLTTAVELGSASACFWKAHWTKGPTPEEMLAAFDAAEACETMENWTPPANYASPRAATRRVLREQTAQGNAEAERMLDRLTALGAFPDA